jgi:hypothetical protein
MLNHPFQFWSLTVTKNEYAYLAYRMWGGDDVLDQLVEALTEDGFIDENQEWIEEDE